MIQGTRGWLRAPSAKVSGAGRSGALLTRLLAVVAAVCLASVGFAATAQAYDQTFTPDWTGSEPVWLIAAMNASRTESHQLARHWTGVNTAFWDVDGVAVYVGTPSQLDAMGQRDSERWMQTHCTAGMHRPHKIDILTAGAFRGCGQPLHGGHYYTRSVKEDEIDLTHEVLEFLVDPAFPVADTRVNGHIAEVCDWVEDDSRYDQAVGAWIPDFVYPSFFTDGRGPYDDFGKLHRPISPTAP